MCPSQGNPKGKKTETPSPCPPPRRRRRLLKSVYIDLMRDKHWFLKST